MSWLNQPMDSQDVFLGLQVFWWNRGVTLTNFLTVGSLIITLLSDQRRVEWLKAIQDVSARASKLKTPKPMRVRTVIKWLSLIGLSVSVFSGFALWGISAPDASPRQIVPFMVMFGMLSLLASLPILAMIWSISNWWSMLHDIGRGAGTLLAFILDDSRRRDALKLIYIAILAFTTVIQLVVQ